MYTPPAFAEPRLDEQHALIRAYPLGLLISADAAGPQATPLPFLIVPGNEGLGTLHAHFARANPHWRALDGADVLVVFQGPDLYMTPSWYRSKQEHGKVVPTWNYAMVQARGHARIVHDTAWLHDLVTRLTDTHESPRVEPWHVSDAPEAYIASQLHAIVGVEIPIRQIEGKWKVSQNRPAIDHPGIADGLAADGHHAMADLVRRYTARKTT